MSNDKYFATLPTEEIGAELEDKITQYKRFLQESGILEELRKSYRAYYGNSAITEYDDGKTTMKVNHYGSLLRSIHTSVTSQRPAFEAMAINTDFESQADTLLAQGLCDYYMRAKRLEEKLKESTEYALFLREGYITADWDVSGGEPYAINPDSGKPIMEGDVLFESHSIVDIIRDVQNLGEQDWYIVKRQKNKWDIIARHPELKDKILGIKDKHDKYYDALDLSYKVSTEKLDTDQINVYTFLHKKCDSVPNGRLINFISHDAILFDGPLPYSRPYVFQISSAKAYQTSFGHSHQMDLLPLQDALDMTFSTILTNHNSFGVQNIMSPKGSGISVQQIADGLNLIEYDSKLGPPAPLNLLQTPQEIFNFATMIIQNQETISGQNAISRGNVPPTMSGTAMALVANQALQFNSGVQHSYNMLLENVGTALIELLQTFASVPRVAQIAGKSKRSLMRTFKSADLEGISRVTVNAGSALSKTSAGKMELANNLLNSGLIKTPEQYITVATTGNLEPLYENQSSQLTLIKQENEWLSEGKATHAFITDDHSNHVLEHSCVANSPEARENGSILNGLFAHIQEHIDLATTISPILAQMLKMAPLQMQAPPPQGEVNPQALDTTNPITEQAEGTELPGMPKIAGTDETFNPQAVQ